MITVADIAARVDELKVRRSVVGRRIADFEAASRNSPYDDEDAVRTVSAALRAAGATVLHAHFLGDTERAHVERLLEVFDLPAGAVVLDAGCGIGGVASEMAALRPDLRFVLLNISPAQLDICPAHFERIVGDVEAVPLPQAAVDVVMLNHVLGHARLERAFAEAVRVLRPGGLMVIYDICVPDSAKLIVTMGYNAHGADQLVGEALRQGFDLDLAVRPDPGKTRLSPIIAGLGEALYQETFGITAPWIFRFRRSSNLKERGDA